MKVIIPEVNVKEKLKDLIKRAFLQDLETKGIAAIEDVGYRVMLWLFWSIARGELPQLNLRDKEFIKNVIEPIAIEVLKEFIEKGFEVKYYTGDKLRKIYWWGISGTVKKKV